MKKLIIMFVVALLIQQTAQAQGTVYLSNLDQTSTGDTSIGSDSWIATQFITGTNIGGYSLDSIQLEMADATGSPNNFTVMIYGLGGPATATWPGSSIGTLSGSLSPINANLYTYTPALSLMLSQDTVYFIVLTSGTTVANGAYEWAYTSTYAYNPSGHWSGGGMFTSSSGSEGSWNYVGYNPQFAITASAIPEPWPLSLLALGSGVLFYVRRDKKRPKQTPAA